MTLTTVSQNLCFGGVQGVYSHASPETGCTMRFGLFLPPQAKDGLVPVLYWLSGLTCTEENFIVKAGAQRVAAELGLAIVAPDTSPRGEGVPDDRDSYDFGQGAGFYVDATQEPWRKHFRMYSYLTEELPWLVASNFAVDPARAGIFGHSMGGHGALVLALRNPQRYKSASAFAPIASPMRCPWGEKALAGYLGEDRNAWRQYDATALIDQGTKDQFLDTQLKPDLLREACAKAGVPLDLRLREGYDHSYFFIATFIEEHLRFHAKALAVRRSAGESVLQQ